jgi:cytochrome c oxidase assembly protein subunit 15
VLILAGGLVTNTGSALAVPDWPTTFGYNMFTYPPSQWVGGIFYEHSHRLLGSLVGMLTIALLISMWRSESRRWVRLLSVAALVGVVAQGILGGLRVILLEHGLAILHGCFAQAFFGLIIALGVVTSPAWNRLALAPPGLARERLRVLALITPVLVYLQIVFGALLTHTGTQLAVHVAGALIVASAIGALVAWVLRREGQPRELRRPAVALLSLLVVQLGLGLWSYLWHYTRLAEVAPFGLGLTILAAHRVTGTLIWAATLILSMRIARVTWIAGRTGGVLRPIAAPREVLA